MRDQGPAGDEQRAGNSEFTPSEEGLDELVHMAFAADLGSASTPRDTPPRTFRDLLGLTGGLPDGIDGPGRALKPGDRLGPYRIEREIGRGGFGVVHLAVKEGLGLRVALKVPRPDLVQNAGLWDNLARDARLAARLNHPAIVAIHDAGPLEGTFFIASQFVAGENLYHYLKRHPGGLPLKQVLALGVVLADALAHAHAENVVHWDLNPANVLVEQSRRADAFPAVLITDFGLGKHLAEQAGQSATISHALRGTAPYIAPEFLLGAAGPFDHRADLYGLGAILYEALTGRPIYRARSSMDLMIVLGKGEPPVAPRRLRTGISRDLETVVLGCLDHDPAARYQTAAEVREELKRVASDLPIRRRRRSTLENLAQWARRKPALAALAGVTAAAVVLLSLLSVRLAYTVREATDAKNQYRRAAEDLAASNREKQKAYEDLQASRDEERIAHYIGDLRYAAEAISSREYEVAQRLLAAHRPAPGQGDDHREFAWRWLWGRACEVYRVMPLAELAWWSPPDTTRPLVQLVEPWASGLRSAHDIRPGFLSNHGGNGAWSYDGEVRHIGFTPGAENPVRLAVAGRRARVELALKLEPPPSHHVRFAWSPDKATLVSASLPFEAVGAPPPLRRREVDLTWLDHEPADAPLPRKLPVVEVPNAHHLTISDDGRYVGLLAYIPDWHVRPVFYDLSSSWRAIYPEKNCWHSIEWKREDWLPSPNRSISNQLALSADGRLAALAAHNPKFEVFETRTGRTLFTSDIDDLDPYAFVTRLAFSPDGSRLVTGHDSGDVLVWDVATGRIKSRFPFPLDSVSFVGFYPDARTIAIVAQKDIIRFWKHEPAPEPPPMRHEQKAEIWDLTFASDGRELVSADDRHRIRITDTATQGEIRTLVDHGSQVSALAISPDQRTLVSGDYDGGLMLRDLDLPGAPGGIGRLPGMVRSMAWSHDGRYLAVCGRAPEIFLWDRKTGEARHIPTPHTNAHSLAWSPDGRTLAVGSHMKQITFWRMPEVSLIKTIDTLSITGLAWSHDGGTLAAGSGEGILLLFEAASGTLRREVRGASDQGAVWDLAFSPDDKTLATGGDDKLVRLWDPATGNELLRLEGHEAKVHAVAFSPDGNTLASGDFAGNLRLWRAAGDE